MKDRFKFIRVYDKETKKFINFNDFKKGDIEFNFDIDTQSICIEYDKSRYDVQQCTSLKDKNGNLIYEGNILKDKYGALHPISWNVKCFYESDTFAVAGFYKAIQEDMEVVGNIYENKELIEQQ